MDDYKDFYPRPEGTDDPAPGIPPLPEDAPPADAPQEPPVTAPLPEDAPPADAPQEPPVTAPLPQDAPPVSAYGTATTGSTPAPDWGSTPPPASPYGTPSGSASDTDPGRPEAPQMQSGSVFYGDPAAGGGQLTPPYPPDTEVPQQKPVTIDKRIYTMCAVAAALVFLLCVYCIGSDLIRGALGDGDISPVNYTVEIKTQKKPDLDPADENVNADGTYTVRGVAELVKPSIVEVYTYSGTEIRERDLEGTGSGIILTDDGFIVTNAHVVQGGAFQVVLDDETEYPAELIGADTKTDLAVLKIQADGPLPAVVLGDSSEVFVGEDVLAIGNPAGLTNSVTRGIVSAIGRQVRAESNAFRMECIQTDAAISPGNSGGALVNMYGQVIGITSSKYASTYSSTYEGLGFAITIDQALPVVQDLIENGYVSGRFRIGIVFSSTADPRVAADLEEFLGEDIPEELADCIWISQVDPECDIANTELRANDFILAVEGQTVTGYDDVLTALEGHEGGDTVTATCARWEKGRVSTFEISFMLEKDTSGNF